MCGMRWLLALMIYVKNELQDGDKQEANNDQDTHTFDEASQALSRSRGAELTRAELTIAQVSGHDLPC